MNEIIQAYKDVIADLEQDIGYEEGAQETALSVLKGRLHELVHVWSIPNEEWVDPTDNNSVAKWVEDSVQASLEKGTNVVDEMNARLSKFDNNEGETNDK